MSYELKIKGIRDPLRIDDHATGLKIKTKWEKYHLGEIKNEMIDFGSWTGFISDIGHFKKIDGSNSLRVSSEKEMREYDVWKAKELTDVSPDEKSKRLGFFRLLYWGFTRKKSEEVKIGEIPIEDFAKKIQLKFFTENPRRSYCDPTLFKSLIKSKDCHQSVVGITENVIRQDYQASK